ncbi:MAG: MscS Mechanosensitive ion channel [Dehalococcoidia bacterium]|nr:MscS Mechanosensitive ion channel [Dehalococcoidia bacterium]
MIPEFFRETLWGELALLLIIAAVSLLVSKLVVFVFDRLLKALTRRTHTTLDDLLIGALRRPVFLFAAVIGIYVALTAVNFLDQHQSKITSVLVATEMALVVYGLNRVVGAVVQWYLTEVAPRTESTLDERLLPLGRKVATGVIFGLGALMVLRALGVDITPLLAGVGIGGLAVALALQPTLNNLIAGAFTVSESKIGVGDYIRLEEGPRSEGMVHDIGWRTTKIQTPLNNIVVIPNARLADTIVTNFGAPSPETLAVISCGVSYESDLKHVQRVADEVARHVLKETRGGVPNAEPLVRFQAFGESNIDFDVLLPVQSYGDRFAVTTAFIQELHERFRAEGIEINYPVRRLITTPEHNAGAPLDPRMAGGVPSTKGTTSG